MSSKLKRKKQEAKPRAPFSNMEVQYKLREFAATRQQLEEIQKAAYDDGFEDGQDWSNTLNTIMMLLALNDLYGFGIDRSHRVVARMNEYAGQVNAREVTVMDLVNRVKEKWNMEIEERPLELIRRAGL